MKQATLYDWMAFILVATICVILLLCFAGPVLFNISTTVENTPIRAQLLDLLNVVSGSVITIIGFKIKEIMNKT